jgi:hypothetical protein
LACRADSCRAPQYDWLLLQVLPSSSHHSWSPASPGPPSGPLHAWGRSDLLLLLLPWALPAAGASLGVVLGAVLGSRLPRFFLPPASGSSTSPAGSGYLGATASPAGSGSLLVRHRHPPPSGSIRCPAGSGSLCWQNRPPPCRLVHCPAGSGSSGCLSFAPSSTTGRSLALRLDREKAPLVSLSQ